MIEFSLTRVPTFLVKPRDTMVDIRVTSVDLFTILILFTNFLQSRLPEITFLQIFTIQVARNKLTIKYVLLFGHVLCTRGANRYVRHVTVFCICTVLCTVP